MNAAGIDVSSRKSTVAVLRPFGEVVRLPFDVAHSTEGLASLAEQLKALDGETRVVLEHTGRYYEPVAKALHEAGLYVSAVNPLLIKEYGANSLRRVKTDKADALKIARYALDNWTDLRDYTPMDTIRYDLKTLNRQFQLASKQRTACSNNLIALLEQSSRTSASALTALYEAMERRNGLTLHIPSGMWTVCGSRATTHFLSVTENGASVTAISSSRTMPRKCMPLQKTLLSWFLSPR